MKKPLRFAASCRSTAKRPRISLVKSERSLMLWRMAVRDEQGRSLLALPDDRILLGYDQSGRPLYVSMRELEATSMHVLGASGFGKSFFLRTVIDQFVLNRCPHTVIDPHGELATYA